MNITWYGHSAFKLDFGSSSVLIDPFLRDNPKFSGDFAKVVSGVTHVLLTHGHGDHLGDTVEIAKMTGACVVADADLTAWLAGQGVERLEPMNTGGTIHLDEFSVSMVQALHSSGSYAAGMAQALGEAHGLIVRAKSEPSVYHMGDTGIFGDMALINEIYAPNVGLVPIGDRFTMGAEVAALACRRYFAFDTIIPCHYATFGLLDQTPDQFRAALDGAADKLVMPEVGQAFRI
jgi:L-ascorbate metabolism protein UlaG (beta-lactamase superfamily)